MMHLHNVLIWFGFTLDHYDIDLVNIYITVFSLHAYWRAMATMPIDYSAVLC